MSRLESLSSELVTKLNRASAAQCLQARIAACELALAAARMESPLVLDSLRKLRAGDRFTAEERSALDDLVMQLDEQYFDLLEATEAGIAMSDDYLQVFVKARAAAALSFACSESINATSESIYEAATAMGSDASSLFVRIESLL